MTSASPATATAPFEPGKGKNHNRPGEQRAAGAPAAGAAPTGVASPGETTAMPERGNHKGRHGEQLQTTPPPTGATSPAGAGSPSETTTMPERGRHKGGKMETSPTESANAPAGAPTVAPEGMPQTGGGKKGNRRLEQGAGPNESGNAAPGETERGNQKGRGLEQATPPAGGASQDLQGQGARRRGEAAHGQPGAPTGGAAEGQPAQGKQEGGKKQKGQPVPAPAASPSPQ